MGKGRCRCAYSTLFALRAKALQSGAPDHGVSREKAGFRNVSPIKGFPGAPGNGETGFSPQGTEFFPHAVPPYALTMSLSPQETEIRPISQTKRAPFPCKTFHIYPSMANAARNKPRLIASRISRRTSGARPSPAFHPMQNRSFPPFPPPPHPPTIPPGERRALPAPAQGSRPLRIPFGGTAHVFPRLLSPQTPQATGPCSWAYRRLSAPSPHSERNAERPPPARGVGVRLPGAEGTGRRHCRPRT